jgi:hypothetical protein
MSEPSFAAQRAIERYQRDTAALKLSANALLPHLGKDQREKLEQLIKALS